MKLYATLFVFFFSANSFANSSHPQAFYQPENEQWAVTPTLAFTDATATYRTGFGDLNTDQSATLFGVHLEYGLTEGIALGIDQDYATTDVDSGSSSYDYSGLTDLEFTLKGNHKVNAFTFRYGATLGFGSVAKEDANGNSSNQYSGRNSITPYIGFDYRVNNSNFGASINQDFLIGKQVVEDANGNESKSTGGNTTSLQVFYEHILDEARLGAGWVYATTSDRKPEGGGNSSEFISITGANLYGAFFLSKQMTLIPALIYLTTPDDTAAGIDIEEYRILSAQVDFRYTF